MPVKLVDALKEMLAGWQNDLPADWQAILSQVELGFDKCDPDLTMAFWEPVFPARRENVFVGAPDGTHIFRAFDNLKPQDVRCVLLGQDPYPAPDFSTGRAFEAGNVSAWRELDKMFSKSVRAFMQLICAARTGQSHYARSFEDWPKLLEDIENNIVDLEEADALADHWVKEGVLLLNSSLTLSRFKVSPDPHQTHGHLPVWRPLIVEVLKYLKESTKPLVFIAFGDVAKQTFGMAGLAENTDHSTVICRPHPAEAEAILALDNPFLACNAALERVGQRPIAW